MVHVCTVTNGKNVPEDYHSCLKESQEYLRLRVSSQYDSVFGQIDKCEVCCPRYKRDFVQDESGHEVPLSICKSRYSPQLFEDLQVHYKSHNRKE